MRTLLRHLLAIFFRLFTHLQVEGVENIPAEGACLLTVNHLSVLDAPLVFHLVPRPDVTALAAKKHRRNPIFRWFVEQADGIWIDRHNPDAAALRQARDLLRRGWIIGIAPEGTRSRTGALIEAKPGVAFLAMQADVPILPAVVWGTEKAWGEWLRFRRPRLGVRFGEPFRLPPVERKRRDADLRRNTRLIMCRLAALLPPTYRGVYAECTEEKADSAEERAG